MTQGLLRAAIGRRPARPGGSGNALCADVDGDAMLYRGLGLAPWAWKWSLAELARRTSFTPLRRTRDVLAIASALACGQWWRRSGPAGPLRFLMSSRYGRPRAAQLAVRRIHPVPCGDCSQLIRMRCRVAGAVARPGSHRTVLALFAHGSSGRRVANPTAGRFIDLDLSLLQGHGWMGRGADG
jgi:hypothetical protein